MDAQEIKVYQEWHDDPCANVTGVSIQVTHTQDVNIWPSDSQSTSVNISQNMPMVKQ